MLLLKVATNSDDGTSEVAQWGCRRWVGELVEEGYVIQDSGVLCHIALLFRLLFRLCQLSSTFILDEDDAGWWCLKL